MVPIRIEEPVHFARSSRSRKVLEAGPTPTRIARPPLVSRLMALAIRLDGLIRSGTIRDQADAARLGKVSRARITQIMNLLHLAPDIQEAILFLPAVDQGRDPVVLKQLLPIAGITSWAGQRTAWMALQPV